MMAAKRALRLTQQELNRYRGELDDAAKMAKEYFESAIGAYEAEHPNATVAEERKFVVELVRTALPNFTDIGATASCDFFDEVREALEWPDDAAAEMYDMTDYDIVEDKIRYFAEHLADGNRRAFVEGVTDMTAYMVKRAAFENMQANCHKHGVRYARIPTGFETCGFCFMLASRGFVYLGEKEAGEGHKYHVNCDCVVVPGFFDEGDDPLVEIDGYDPKGMSNRWQSCVASLGGFGQLEAEWKALPEDERQKWLDRYENDADARRAWSNRQIAKEAECRDRHWLYTGELPRQDYSQVSRDSFGRLKNEPDWKSRPDPADYDPDNFLTRNSNGDWKDLFAHDVLKWNGYGITTRPKNFPGPNGKNQQGATSPDLAFQRDVWGRGYLWEVKSPKPEDKEPKPGNELNFISNAFEDAHKRNFKRPFDPVTNEQVSDWDGKRRVVLNTRYRPIPQICSYGDVIAKIESEMTFWNISEVIWIDAEGNLVHIKK